MTFGNSHNKVQAMARQGFTRRAVREVSAPSAYEGVTRALRSAYAGEATLPADFTSLLDRLR